MHSVDTIGNACRVSPFMIRCLSSLVLALLVTLPVSAGIKWRNGPPVPSAEVQQAALQQSFEEFGRSTETQRIVLRFAGPLDRLSRESLESSGVKLLGYLGDHSYFAALTSELDPQRASTIEGLLQAAPIDPANKLHPDLTRGVVHPWSIVKSSGAGGDASAPGGEKNPTIALYVLFHRDFELDAGARALLARHGGKVSSFIHSINGVVAHLPANNATSLAGEDAVMYVEPPLPQFIGINDINRPRVEADLLQQAPYDLDGSGVDVLVYDGGQIFAHPDFGARLTIGASDTSSISDHATHVGGTIGGDGSGSAGQYRGMAPGVALISYGFEQEGGLVQGFLYTDPGDLEADYTEAITLYGADLSNNSIGTNTASNGFPCDWEGNYGATGALIDAIARGSLGDPFRIVWANGNERSSGACGTTYLTTAPPACAKNHITVGALNSDTDTVTDFTSWGPTDDGRLKPDISGPGCEAGGDGGVTSTSSAGGYTTKCGTSMASPTIAGVAALLLEQYRLSFPAAADPRNSTLKAILANSAAEIGEVGPDYQSGYGSVRGVPAVDTIIEERFLEAEVAQDETYSFIILVGPGDTELKVTLAWDDFPGTPNVNPVLVNDLDLRVIDGSSVMHFPWTLDPALPEDPAVRTVADHVNNIEQVVIDAPAPGAYRVEVLGFNIAEGATQSFSIAASPSLINCAPIGVLAVNTRRVACEATLEFDVIDCDLNTDDGLIETVNIDVTSPSEPGGEVVTLTESAAESAAFEGALPVSTVDAPGTLWISEGETITATYIDADDGQGGLNVPVTRQIVVDCTSPVITDVSTSDLQPRSATISIAIDEPARVTVWYGTTCGAPTDSALRFALDVLQEVALSGLADDTTYYFHVEAEDEAGNDTLDDNSGACYSFTTPEVPDFFTEQFSGGIDLVGSLTTFVPSGSVDFYAFCTEPLSGVLPTDPAGGTDLGLSDDQPGSFTLSGGQTVSLYGESYDTIYVGPNGYLTFGSGDSTYTETLSAHFSLPRIAAVFDDLNPSAGGSVSWKQLADRVAVTWDAVPEYSTSNSNTFQIEVFFDGQIRLSWLQLDSADAVTGLSAGLGLDPDFYETDLSDNSGCGPRPPRAQSFSVQTAVDQPLGITLLADDDGLPEPASLNYRIISLPAAGTLIDAGTASEISVVPHQLALGGDSVTYQPVSSFQGGDSFEYTAHDGGLPPDGGESNIGTLGITVGGPGVIYEFLVDDSDPGWSTTGDWTFGQPTGGGSHNFDPVSGATGLNVYGYNLNGDYVDNMSLEYLTSTALDLSMALDTSLEYQRWLGVESSAYDHATVEISSDGSNWTTIWDHSGGALSESAWSLQSYDISAAADGQATVYLRWQMGTTDGSVTYPGWNIDDIRIMGVIPLGADCDPADPDIWRIPIEVHNLHVNGSTSTDLSWDGQELLAGPATLYELISGPVTESGLDFDSPTCLQSTTAVGYSELRPDPAAGTGFWYLVRAWNSCGGTTYGNAERDSAFPDSDGDGQSDVCD